MPNFSACFCIYKKLYVRFSFNYAIMHTIPYFRSAIINEFFIDQITLVSDQNFVDVVPRIGI